MSNVGMSNGREKERLICDEEIEGGYSSTISSNATHNANNKIRRGSLTGKFESFDHSSYALQLCIFITLIYTVVGTIGFKLRDGWSVIDALYFVVVTFTTCGYGDLYPEDDIQRLYTCLYVLIGVAVLGGYSLTVISERLIESYANKIKTENMSSNASFVKKFKSDTEKYLQNKFDGGPEKDETESITSNMKEVFRDTGPFLLLILASAIYIGYVEGWSIITSVYFLIITGTTVGYGDVEPQSQSMRLFAVFFIPLSVGTLANLFGRLTSIVVSHKATNVQKEFLKRKMTEIDFKRMDVDKDDQVSYEEFITFMLVSMGKVEHEDMLQLNVIYHQLSVGKGGIRLSDLQRRRDSTST